MIVAICLLLASPSLAQTIATVAGNGTLGSTGDGGAATSAELAAPKFIIVDNANDWLIADRDNNKIRKVNVSGFISTFAGTGSSGASGDGGAATSAQLGGPFAVAVDAAGNVYISDSNNHKIRKVDTGGNISTFAGTGAGGYGGDGGAATSAQLQSPLGIAIDASGNLYIADNNNQRIRKVDTGGTISTVAGNGTGAFSGDGGAATSAQLQFPTGVAVDAAGNLYITDQSNQRIRKVDTGGTISTVAGNGAGGFSGDGGPATSAQINSPVGIAVDAAGNLYIGDQSNHRIRKVDTVGIISTIAGTGSNGYNGDGIAPTSAQLNFPNGVFAKDGYLFVADNGNNRIRRFALPPDLSSTSPTKHAYNVVLNSNISATFSQTMTASTASSFRAFGSMTGKLSGSYSGQSTSTLTFNPSNNFKRGEEIEVVFASGSTIGTKNKAGIALQRPYVYRFRAAAAVGPAQFVDYAIGLGSGSGDTEYIALADVDGDGDLDIGVANASSQQDNVYLNNGTLGFATAKPFGTGSDNSLSLVFGDIDGDGDVDVGVGNSVQQNQVYFNDGAGNFSSPGNFGTGSDNSQMLRLGDVDGDGDLDMATGNTSNQQNVVYFNSGAGNFAGGSSNIGGTLNTTGLVLGDVDNDGDLDAGVGNSTQQNAVYLNDGKGNFTAGTKNFGTGTDGTEWVDFGDIDGDGDLDVAVGNNAAQNAAYLNDGKGNFSGGNNFGTGSDATYCVLLADVDGDGDLDVAVSNSTQDVVYLNNGSGSFSAGSRNFGGASANARAVAAGDMDNDGDLDLVSGVKTSQNFVHLNGTAPTVSSTSPTANTRNAARTTNISGTFSAAMTAASTASFLVFAAHKGKRAGVYSGGSSSTLTFDPSADFGAGERVEAVFSASSTSGVRSTANAPLAKGYVWRFVAASGAGPANFSGTGLSMGGASDNSYAIAFADVDGDGDLDAIVGNSGQQSAAYINNGSSFSGGTRTIGGGSDATRALPIADLDGDGDADVAAAKSGAQNAAYLNDGSGNFATVRNFGSGTDATQALVLGDIDGDGDQDIAAGNNGAQNAAYLNDGSGNFAIVRNFGSGTDASVALVLGDVDGDGDLDVGVGNSSAQNAVYLNDGFANFSAGTKNFGTGSDNTKALFLGDVDGDGDLDVGVGNSSAQNAAYLNDGSGNFAAGIKNFGTGSDATESLALGDVDGDGDFDLAVGNNAQQSAVYLNDGSGNFAAGTKNFATSSNVVQAIAMADINGDFDLELGVALNGQQSIAWPNASFVESKAAVGLVGAGTVSPGSAVTVLTLGVTGDGVETAQALAVTIGDLSAATGLVSADLSALKAYMSRDSLYDSSDSLLASNSTVNIGSSTALSFTHVSPKDSLRYYLARVATASAATSGHAFRVSFAAGGLTTTIGGRGSAVNASDSNKYTLSSPLVVSTPVASLNSVREVAAGAEVKLLSFGLKGNGSETFTSVALTLSDLTTATGISTGDIQALKLYASADTALNTSTDSLLVTQSALSFTAATTLTAPVADAPPIGVERFYIVSAKIDTTAIDARAFKLSFATGGISSSQGALGAAVAASDSHAVKIQIVAAKLAFSQLPADSTVVDLSDEVVSGKVFSRPPIVAAQDLYGNVDIHFAETVTLSLTSGSGALSGVQTKAFVNGLADYGGSNLSYAAASDGENFVLNADDEVGGVDLIAVSSGTLSADVVATKLAFAKQPAPLLDPGINFAPDTVIVKAQNALGLTDADYAKYIYLRAVAAEDSTLAVDSLKAVPGDSILASGGAASWTELVLKEADLIRLTAKSGTLQPGLSNVVAIPGGLTVGNADSLVALNALKGLAGVGGVDLVLNALALRANGERMALLELRVRPVFGGLSREELRHLDVVYDADADGRVDSNEVSVLVAALDDAGSGTELTLSVRDTLPADTLRSYLLVADLDHTVRSTDSLRIDLTGIRVGSGLSTGVTPTVPVSQIAGRTHIITGAVDMISAVLANPRTGQSGSLKIVFDTVSDLVVGDEIAIDFPVGFDVSAVAVDVATKTPSGVDPSLGVESAGRTIVLVLNAVEGRGRYEIVLAGVKNPNVDSGASPILLRTRSADNQLVDADDPQALGLVLAGLGQVRVDSISVMPREVGALATLSLNFTTATALSANDEITLAFPAGFLLASARLATTSSTPSGVAPALLIDTTAGQLVVDLGAAEEAGRFALVLAGIGLPNVARNGQVVRVRTRSAVGAEIDQPASEPPSFAVVGKLLVEEGAQVGDGLLGLAGVGGTSIALAAFALKAQGEAIAPEGITLSVEFGGAGKTALTALDVVVDSDGDGLVGSADSSLVVSLGAIGARGEVEIVLAAPLIASAARRSFLVVGDFSSQLAAADQIRVTVKAVQGGLGQTSALAITSSGGPIVGPQHTASGFVDMQRVDLQKRQANQRGPVQLLFATATPLGAGGQIELRFPKGFDLSQASIDTASSTPSGALPQQLHALSTRNSFVVEMASAEAAGVYSIALQKVVNPAAATGLSVAISTRRGDGRHLDGADPDPFLFAIEEAGLPAACRADFDGDGRVYFADLFRFGDAFGRAESTAFDLDGDGAIGFTDFFIFSEVFGQRCDASQIDPGGEEPLALELAEALPGGEKMSFVLVRAGSFAMGSAASEEGRSIEEGPVRQVSLGADFYLGKYEVTQAQWTAVMGSKPWLGLPAALDVGTHPAVYIAWDDAQAFIQALNAAAGASLYRLPSEAEWEYAARAGTKTRWSFGDDAALLATYAWTRTVPPLASELVTHPVGSKRANAWDLYDMHGSSGEWVGDFYATYPAAAASDPTGPSSGSEHVLRGGGTLLSSEQTRSASRAAFSADLRLSTFGFRVLRRIP